MEIIQIVGISLVTTILVVLIRQEKPEIAIQLGIVLGVIIFLRMIDKVIAVVNILLDLSKKADIDSLYLSTILKIVGISYIAEFGSQICKDAGSSSIAAKIEFSAKIIILVLSAPILLAVMDLLIKILP